MKIKEIISRIILDSNKNRTIQVEVRSDYGTFITSAPSGKSTGKNEIPSYKINIEEDAKQLVNLSAKVEKINFEKFVDLVKLEEQVKDLIGANSLYALELSILKALAIEKEKPLWQFLNPNAKRLPKPIGNCIGGGLHSQLTNGLKPDFQEFLVIPREQNFLDNVFLMKKAHEIAGNILKMRNARGILDKENAWSTSLSNHDVLEVMRSVRNELQDSGQNVEMGVDIASSSFFRNNGYEYKNAYKRINSNEQRIFIENLIKDFSLFYVEDPLHEEDFFGFSQLRQSLLRTKNCLVVGDDLICSKTERLMKAIESGSINAVIVKPNQVGSLIDIARLVSLAKKQNIITVMSHRAGETLDYGIADLAFALQTEFIKTGILGREREVKLSRLIEIEKSIS